MLASKTVYPNGPPVTTGRGVSGHSGIEAAKTEIPTIDLADRLCGPGQLRRIGAEWVGRCPLPDHADRTPSFSVSPERGLWHCFGCQRGGDVVELARLVWGYEKREAAMAAADLLHEFGHEIPPKPASWYARQQRQEPVRAALEEAAVRRVQRRLYRWILAPIIATFEDAGERREEAARAWEDAGYIARLIVARARGEGAA